MKRSLTLRNVCACGIVAALDVLAEAALKRLGPNHPPCPDLAVLKVEEHMVPLSINLPACLAAYGIFTERPAPYNPWGKRVLGVSVRLCDACPSHPRAGAPEGLPCGERRRDGCPSRGHDGCHARCRGCANACWPELTVYITQLPEFPLPPADVDWFFYHYFNMHAQAAATIPEGYRYLYVIACQCHAPAAPAAAPLTGLDAADTGGEPVPAAPGTSQPAPRRGPGAPQLFCNVWLFNQMCALPDPHACSHLRPGWQEFYLQEMGVPPENWEKSFRAAARYCRLRILRARGEPHSLAPDDQAGNKQDGQQDAEPPA